MSDLPITGRLSRSRDTEKQIEPSGGPRRTGLPSTLMTGSRTVLYIHTSPHSPHSFYCICGVFKVLIFDPKGNLRTCCFSRHIFPLALHWIQVLVNAMSDPLSRPRTFTKDSEDKSSDSQLEFSTNKEQPTVKHGDAALEILGDGAIHFEVTEDQDRRVLRKIDMWLLPIVLLVYFLQQLDKSSLSYTSVFGIVAETGELGFC